MRLSRKRNEDEEATEKVRERDTSQSSLLIRERVKGRHCAVIRFVLRIVLFFFSLVPNFDASPLLLGTVEYTCIYETW